MATAATVSGAVTDANSGDSIAGASVSLIRFTIGQQGTVDTVQDTVTDPDGVYSFEGVENGWYSLRAQKNGYVNNNQTVQVEDNQDTRADIALEPVTGENSGFVEGAVSDADNGERIDSAMVLLGRSDFSGGITLLDTTYSNLEGVYFFDSVPAANRYHVGVRKKGFEEDTSARFSVAAGETTTVNLGLTPLQPANAVIMGTITDSAHQQGLENASVILRQRAGGGSNSWDYLDTVTSAADGDYRFDSLYANSNEAGAYSVMASVAEYYPGDSSGIRVAENDTAVVDIVLSEYSKGNLYVFVGTENNQDPLQNSSVTAEMSGTLDTSYSGITNGSGWVAFSRVIAGSYSVTAAHAGYSPETVTRAVEKNENDTAYILLAESQEKQKVLSGIVRDAGGNAVQGAALALKVHTTDYSLTLYDTSNATGDYSIDGIPGTCASGSLSVEAEQYKPYAKEVDLPSDTTYYNVTLQAPVMVRKNDQQPGGDSRIRVSGQARGQLFITGLHPGRFSSIQLYTAQGRLVVDAAIDRQQSGLVVSIPQRVKNRGILYMQLRSEQGNAAHTAVLSPVQ